MVSRTFHVLYVPDGLIASCIDAIRVLANPGEKHRSHITVRGPYPSSRNQFDNISRFVEGSEIKIDGAGNFFESGQNTVYLQCESPKLEHVWYKPDYGFNPHITLYDGSSYEFSRRLWEIVSSRTYDISFMAGPLTPLVSSRRRQGGMVLQADLDSRLLRDVADLDTDEVTVEGLGQDDRLKAIDKLCNFLSKIDSRWTSPQRQVFSHEEKGVEIEVVDINSTVLSGIKSLAKKNSSTLGFLPEGAFDAYAQSGWILAAIEEGELVGYVVYRESRMRAVLVHLCTDERYRGRGIARELFRSVVGRTSELRGILANTRRDFPAHTMWPRLGFTAIGERPGRGKKQTVLSRWWYEHPHPTLFSNTAFSIHTQSPIDVAMDLNVFYDLVMPSSGDGADESRSLQSDWLTDEIQLCVTGELFNEINRLPGTQVRKKQRDQAHEFKRISGTAEAFDKAYSLLSSIIGEAKSNRQSSDLRHLAHTAAAGVEYFVTRDAQILKYQSEIESETGVTPIRPADLVIHVDQVRNVASYQPVRLRGSTLQVRKVERQQREKIEDIFVSKSLGEKKAEFKRRLSAILASPPTVDLRVVLEDGEPIALFGMDWSNLNTLTIPCLRLRHGRLARTLARQIVTLAIDSSIANNDSITAVTDDWLEPHAEEALAECGFIRTGPQWLKLNYTAIGTEDDVSAGLKRLLKQAKDSGFELPGTQLFPAPSGMPINGNRYSASRKESPPAEAYQ